MAKNAKRKTPTPEEIAAALKKIEETKKYYKIHLFNKEAMPANPAQKELIEAFESGLYKIFTYTGGNQIGKTSLGVILDICILLGKWIWSGEKIKFNHNEPRKIRLIGQDWENQIKTVVVPTLREWWPKDMHLVGGKAKKNQNGVEHFWQHEESGSTIEIMSNRQDSELMEGWIGDHIHYEEPPKRPIRIACMRGLIKRCGTEFFGMTLLSEAWVHREVIKKLNEHGRPDKAVYNVNADISVNVGYGITQQGVEQFKSGLKPEEIEARIHGKPAYLSNVIYPKFNRQLHLIDSVNDRTGKKFEVPLDWIVDIAIDFHPSKPWAVLFLGTDRRGFKYCIDEIWENSSWKALGEKIIRKIKNNNYRVNQIIIDPLAKGDPNSDLKEESVFDKMKNFFFPFGYSLKGATKDRAGGIEFVNDLLWTENEMPALFSLDNLPRTIQCIEDYMYVVAQDGTRKPTKENDDQCENLGRLVMLDTQYVEMGAEYDDYQETASSAANCTGY